MPKYLATVRHSSISKARTIETEGTLTQAKRAAAQEFGQEQWDYEIIVAEVLDSGEHRIVAGRLVGGEYINKRWFPYD